MVTIAYQMEKLPASFVWDPMRPLAEVDKMIDQSESFAHWFELNLSDGRIDSKGQDKSLRIPLWISRSREKVPLSKFRNDEVPAAKATKPPTSKTTH